MPRGGKRSGAGRPTSDRSVPVTVRLSQRSAEFLKSQNNQSEFVEELIQMAVATQRAIDQINKIISPASIVPDGNGFTIKNGEQEKYRTTLGSAIDCAYFWGLLTDDQYHNCCPNSDLLQ